MVLQPGMQGFHDRSTSLVAYLSSMLAGMAPDLSLDRVELADAHQHLGGQWRGGGGKELVERPPHVGPAERQPHRAVGAIPGQPLEPGIAIDLEHAAEVGQVSGGTRTLAVLGIHVGCRRARWSTPRTIIDGVAPQPSCLGPTAAGIEHRQRGVVGEQLGGRQHRADNQVVYRCQPPAGASNPVAQRRAIQRDTLAAQHLRLPIQRQGIAILADHHVRDQRLGGHAAIDWTIRRRCYHHRPLTSATGVPGSAGDTHAQLCGHDVQLFGAHLADAVHDAAATRACPMLGIDDHVITRQVRRQRAMIASGAFGAGFELATARELRRILLGLVLGDCLLQVLQAELQLIRRQLLGAAAKLVARQALDQQAKLVVLGMQFALLVQDHAQHLLQQGGIVR
jgi:hypothetical protein